MLSDLIDLARGVLGILAVLIVWFVIQAFIRRRSGCGSNEDVLDFMKHGCSGCKGSGACHKRGTQGKHHELA